ncbi:hypothetical protein CEXT_469971 [Caerostris extrusa]|uniref:Uncharacterized protein n=1 Tax=Caerostris extrusa TaxID=172846 RepID=A0AAV4XWS3_CAEEX|nr:hypothetical protein CEXT_469971 [Caerostris extrusa]
MAILERRYRSSFSLPLDGLADESPILKDSFPSTLTFPPPSHSTQISFCKRIRREYEKRPLGVHFHIWQVIEILASNITKGLIIIGLQEKSRFVRFITRAEERNPCQEQFVSH